MIIELQGSVCGSIATAATRPSALPALTLNTGSMALSGNHDDDDNDDDDDDDDDDDGDDRRRRSRVMMRIFVILYTEKDHNVFQALSFTEL